MAQALDSLLSKENTRVNFLLLQPGPLN